MEFSEQRFDAFMKEALNKYNWEDILYSFKLDEYRDLGTQLELKCPFHEDKRPSFRADKTKNVYHCFSCGRSGSIIYFSYLMSESKIPFRAYCDNILAQDKELQHRLGFITLKNSSKEISSKFTSKRVFNKKAMVGKTSYSTLLELEKNNDMSWDNLVLSLTLLQNGISTTDVYKSLQIANNEKTKVDLMDIIGD